MKIIKLATDSNDDPFWVRWTCPITNIYIGAPVIAGQGVVGDYDVFMGCGHYADTATTFEGALAIARGLDPKCKIPKMGVRAP